MPEALGIHKGNIALATADHMEYKLGVQESC